MNKVRFDMIGGGQGAFIGGVHRTAAAIAGNWDLVAGAFSSTPIRRRLPAATVVSQATETGTPGLGIHEMGTARMGTDPSNSVLNKWNQCHDVPNLFITDGAAMASSACQNPSLTYMALSARAADAAASMLQEGAL